MPRDSNGTYSLPAGNPVVTETVIESAWANTTMTDIGTALTDSLDRAGSGPMTGQLKLANGTIGAPGLSWGTEPTSGLYRNAAGDHRYSISSNDVLQLSAAVVRSFATQFQVANGAVATPAYSYGAETNAGWYRSGAGDHRYSIGAADVLQVIAGAFRTPAGVVGAPGMSFVVDTDLGWYRAGANDMRGVANGADVLAITTAGIAVTGAATVSATLGVTGASTFTGTTTFNKSAAANAPAILMSSALPNIEWNETGAAANNRAWRIFAASEALNYAVRDDADSASVSYLVVNRTNNTIDTVNFANGTLQYGGLEVGFRNANLVDIPGNVTLSESNRGRLHQYSGGGGHTITIPTTGSPDGCVWPILINNGSVTLAVSSGTLYWYSGAGLTTGTRTLAGGAAITVFSRANAAADAYVTGSGIT